MIATGVVLALTALGAGLTGEYWPGAVGAAALLCLVVWDGRRERHRREHRHALREAAWNAGDRRLDR